MASIVADELARSGIMPASADAVRLRVYSRKLWRLLRRNTDSRQLEPKLEKLDRWATAEGMTQQELAVLMGRQGKGNHHLIGKVELGKAPFPSLGFVADYLRACRASFNDIADLLNAYTFQPTVIEQRGYKRVRSLARKLSASVADAVERYDHRVTRSRSKPEPVRKRLKNVRAYARAQESQSRLSQLVESEIMASRLGSVSPEAVWLRVYARKLYRLLTRSRDERKLKTKLDELERRAQDAGIGSLPVLAALRDRIKVLVSVRVPRS